VGPLSPSTFQAAYESTPPWDIGEPQPAIAKIADGIRGSVLDIGCGTGEHALLFAARGQEAVGVDIVSRAIELAREKAQTRGVRASFVVGDALELEKLGRTFDHVIDSGLFHVFDDAMRPRYVASLSRVVAPGGALHLLCFSENTPGAFGPRRVTQAELRASFASGWTITSIEDVPFQTRFAGQGARGWLANIVRSAT
jgi:ubiquinone/menaquinone biosynthesis C-methylase UbiE